MTAPVLERLARGYSAARNLPALGRSAQIKYLVWDALSAMEPQDQADAALVRALFFGDMRPGSSRPGTVTRTAGELLEHALERSGLNEIRFRDVRNAAIRQFSGFLLQFAAQFRPATTEDGARASGPHRQEISDDSRPASSERRTHPLRTGHIDEGERFTQLLSEAVNVTIVGFTNENLTVMLANALELKQAAAGDPEAFWSSLRIVFFSNKLLDAITDERPEYPDRREALRQRRLAAIHGRRSVTVFLRRLRPTRWMILESQYMPPFIGTLFEFGTGRRVVHLLIRHPQRSASDHLYLEVDETSDQYFSSVFEDVVHNSVDQNKIVPIGVPRNGMFQATGRRYRHNVLRDGTGAVGWLPYVMVVTWRMRAGGTEPVLQLRSTVNAAKELDRLTHIATHLFQDDYIDVAGGPQTGLPATFDLDHEGPKRTARRRLYTEAGEDLPGDLVPVATDQYLHHDKEHLFFFVYSREVPGDFQFPRRAEMYPVPLSELTAILGNQALRKAELLFSAPALPKRLHAAATEIASLNLILHGSRGLGERLGTLSGPRWEDDDVAAAIRREIARTRQPWYSLGREVDIKGLSGLHYRAFFTLLLPLYARLGIPGAAEYLDEVTADPVTSAAIARLAELYHDEELMAALPVEL